MNYLKTTVITLYFLLFTICAISQPPRQFNYQAVIRDDAGQAIVAEEVAVDIAILQGSPQGESVFSETHHTETNEYGLIDLQIGSVNELGDIDWGSDAYFVEIKVNGELMGTSQLYSVPFALRSETSGDAFSGDYHDLDNQPDLDHFVDLADPETGDMIFFDGESWNAIPVGDDNQYLVMQEGSPQWTTIAFKPEVITTAVSNITEHSAQSGGHVIGDGGADVTTRGVVWCTSPNPDLDDHEGYTSDGQGTGAFTSEMTGLLEETTYYVRAYATNSEGTSYGNEFEFETIAEVITYVLALEANPEEGGAVAGDGEYEAGQEVQVTATPADGYVFLNWVDDEDNLVSDEATFDYTMPAEDVTLTAQFEEEADGTVTDIDGNVYTTVTIDDTEWMAENLRTTRYANGDDIPGNLDSDDWLDATEGAYAVFPHDDVSGIDSEEEMVDAYGKLYNWFAQDDDRGLCPDGWRVPTDAEWTSLTDYLIDNYSGIHSNNVANRLKDCRQEGSPIGGDCDTTEHPRWDSHNSHHGTDEFDFSALPAGARIGGNFHFNGWYGYWWSASAHSDEEAWSRTMMNSSGSVSRGYGNKTNGGAIRCIKDE